MCVTAADIRKLYYQAGVENKPTVFLFTDTQVVEETFLEDINNILSSGEVPNLYKPDEFEEVNIPNCIPYGNKVSRVLISSFSLTYISALVHSMVYIQATKSGIY